MERVSVAKERGTSELFAHSRALNAGGPRARMISTGGKRSPRVLPIVLASLLLSCSESPVNPDTDQPHIVEGFEVFGGDIDPLAMDSYQAQAVPDYIFKDNTVDNAITDAGATLGRILFYDKKLSIDNSIACASCHQQSLAFGDPNPLSEGVNGTTPRHSMRLVNSRFSSESRFLWGEEATSLESQTADPIEDHLEMGFSGRDGQPDFDDLIERLSRETYYLYMFRLVFGDEAITRERISQSLAQFIRSIQSFDSRFDEGLRQVTDISEPFPNYTDEENLGKVIFLLPNGGIGSVGAGCQGCHVAPEFDIDPDSRNNGVIDGPDGSGQLDLQITRAPSLRDLFNPSGALNGPLMHTGEFVDIESVINHYAAIPDDPRNMNLDPRLRTAEGTQVLQLSRRERSALIAFLKTLTGSSIYTEPMYSDPF